MSKTKTIKIAIGPQGVISVIQVPKGVEVEIEDTETGSYATFEAGNNNVSSVGLT